MCIAVQGPAAADWRGIYRDRRIWKTIIIMARIIYKEGCEGQNTLESIEGIEIELLNGQKALI